MNILGIETSGEMCSVALLHGQNEFEIRRLSRKRHSEILMDMVEEVLHRRRIRFSDISAVAVDVGPGSYTGLRVGIMTAKALSFALGVPAVGVPSLLALAHAVSEKGIVAPCLAGLGAEVYTALYKLKPPCTIKRKAAGLTKLENFRRIGIEEWLEHLSRQFLPGQADLPAGRQVCFAGSGAGRHRDLILRRGFRISPQTNPQALWIAHLGKGQLLRQRTPQPLNPIYLAR